MILPSRIVELGIPHAEVADGLKELLRTYHIHTVAEIQMALKELRFTRQDSLDEFRNLASQRRSGDVPLEHVGQPNV